MSSAVCLLACAPCMAAASDGDQLERVRYACRGMLEQLPPVIVREVGLYSGQVYAWPYLRCGAAG